MVSCAFVFYTHKVLSLHFHCVSNYRYHKIINNMSHYNFHSADYVFIFGPLRSMGIVCEFAMSKSYVKNPILGSIF